MPALWRLAPAPRRCLGGLDIGDEEVAAGYGWDTRFADVAILSSERRDTVEIVPQQERRERQGRHLLVRASGT